MLLPSIGRIVHYRLTEQDAEQINRRRQHARIAMPEHVANSNGVQVHVGNEVHAGEVYPMMITRVWSADPNEGTAVQGQVFLDGNDLFWATSVAQEGYLDGTNGAQGVWFEPPRVHHPAEKGASKP